MGQRHSICIFYLYVGSLKQCLERLNVFLFLLMIPAEIMTLSTSYRRLLIFLAMKVQLHLSSSPYLSSSQASCRLQIWEPRAISMPSYVLETISQRKQERSLMLSSPQLPIKERMVFAISFKLWVSLYLLFPPFFIYFTRWISSFCWAESMMTFCSSLPSIGELWVFEVRVGSCYKL